MGIGKTGAAATHTFGYATGMAESCPECPVLRQRLTELEAKVEQLTRLLEEQRRAGKRQAAPFSKGLSKGKPKKPGRKAGAKHGKHGHRPPPSGKIDVTYDAPLPDICPNCGGVVDETDIQQQYQVEIPRLPIQRQFNVHIGKCRRCQCRVQGRHPLQTSDALGAAASQLGPDTQAAVVDLNKNAGLSHGKIVRTLNHLFGISLTRGGSVHAVLRAGRRCTKVYQAICQSVRQSPWVVPDETGWRVGGVPAWLHGFVGTQSSAYVVDANRDHQPAEQILGLDYAGAMVHDGWAPYDRFKKAAHQQCNQHILRRCDEMLETATRGAVHFPRRIATLLRQGLTLRDRHAAGEVSDHGRAVARGRLQHALEDAVFPTKTAVVNERMAKHLWKHIKEFFTFLRFPSLDATNWRAEQAMRFGVILRKVWGGNRTWAGAKAQAILMSVWRTCWQQGRIALDFLSQLLRGQIEALALPP
jgi:transposase